VKLILWVVRGVVLLTPSGRNGRINWPMEDWGKVTIFFRTVYTEGLSKHWSDLRSDRRFGDRLVHPGLQSWHSLAPCGNTEDQCPWAGPCKTGAPSSLPGEEDSEDAP
jgi:hypothetical protein